MPFPISSTLLHFKSGYRQSPAHSQLEALLPCPQTKLASRFMHSIPFAALGPALPLPTSSTALLKCHLGPDAARLQSPWLAVPFLNVDAQHSCCPLGPPTTIKATHGT